jgi:hypothetical protein
MVKTDLETNGKIQRPQETLNKSLLKMRSKNHVQRTGSFSNIISARKYKLFYKSDLKNKNQLQFFKQSSDEYFA